MIMGAALLENTTDKKRKTTGNSMDLDKARGVIYGLAIGDALGARTEFLKLDQIRARFGKDGIRDLPVQALFTDDTQMSIAIAEALVKAGEKDIESIMTAVRDEFIKWSHLPETCTKAPGNTCLKGVANLERGVHWTRSGIASSKGCGSAMRAAPIGYLYENDPEKLREVAMQPASAPTVIPRRMRLVSVRPISSSSLLTAWHLKR